MSERPRAGCQGLGRRAASERAFAGRSANFSGLAAEDIALRLYGDAQVVATRWRCPEGEIDLILGAPGLVVFVEVKARRSLDHAARSLTWRQRARIGAAAARYLSERADASLDARFDVVLVDGLGRAERIENAFAYEA